MVKGKAGAKPKIRGASPARISRATIKPASASPAVASSRSASGLIDQRIRDLDGWRGATLARMRALILEAAPGMIEEWKWEVPVWSHHGIVCTGETYKQTVKLTFPQGARIPDPTHLFNASLEGGTRRAIDLREGETIAVDDFTALVRGAVVYNGSLAKKR